MGTLVEKARQYAVSAHSRINQLRKYNQQPYDVHLRAVAKLVSSVTDDEAVIAAAWLHDTVEDTSATFEDIEREFGPDVMELVKELTDISRPGDGNRAIRKEIDRRHLSSASARGKTIKLADLIDNCEDICRNDPKFGRVYVAEMQALLEALSEGNPKLYARAVKTAAHCARELKQPPAAPAEGDSGQGFLDKIPVNLIPGQRGIKRFTEAFAARDIQEPLLSIDEESLGKAGIDPGELTAQAILGIRRKGIVSGYITREDLSAEAPCRTREFDPRQVLDLEASLADVIHVLTHFSFCFVSIDGNVFGVISREDIEKPVVRMWIFGIIITIEMLVVSLIRLKWPDEEWVDRLSKGRVEKARQMQSERFRRGLGADLLDCLQFSDKMQIALKDPVFLEGAGFSSVSAAQKAAAELESLRNDLAHGQNITRHDWIPIARLARRIEQMYGA